MTTNLTKKVLMVAYHFPPDAAVGALRPQKFVKHLPEFGWEPHVLTIREKYIEQFDADRLEDVAHAKIIRTDFWRTPLRILMDITHDFRHSRRGITMEAGGAVTAATGSNGKGESFAARLKRYFYALNWFVDDQLYWTIPAVYAGLKTIRREKIPVVYATAPPHTVAWIGYCLSILSGTRLVIDFRDPWILSRTIRVAEIRCALLDSLERKLERVVIGRADVVICNTDRVKEELQKQFKQLPGSKFVTIFNGFDDVTPAPETDVASASKFVITYAGSFCQDRNPIGFLKAVQQLLQEKVQHSDRIEIHFIGGKTFGNGAPLSGELESLGLTGVVTLFGQRSHKETLQLMQKSDVLLLLAPNQPYQIPRKTFEYIGAHRPVLALTEVGATADLIYETGAGLVARQDDQQGIYSALREMMRLHYTGENPWYQCGDVAKFNLETLTGKLAAILKNIVQREQI